LRVTGRFVLWMSVAGAWGLACGGRSVGSSENAHGGRDGDDGAAMTGGSTSGAATGGTATGGDVTAGGGVAGSGAGGSTGGRGGSSSGLGGIAGATGGESVTGGSNAGGEGADSGTGGSSGGGGSEPETCERGACAEGELWNPWLRRCQSSSLDCPPPGEKNGGRCTTEADCRSNGTGAQFDSMCIRENGADYCVSRCTLPADYGVPDAFVQSDCPDGSLCLRPFPSIDAPELARCVPECHDDSDCRTADGYYCRRTLRERTYENGYCAPAHCRSRGCDGFLCSC
jgi:hypothetical protein